MKSMRNRSKSILLAFCFILMIGTIVSAQQTTSNGSENLSAPSTKTPVSAADEKEFYRLTDNVTVILSQGNMESAKENAEILLKQAESMRDNWNYGNAVHIGNLVLGHVALAAGDLDEAKRFLLAAGKTPGSAQLNTFGPNMRLAKALLEKGESEVVIEYFDLCAKFWKSKSSHTEEWKAAVRKKETPDFGANLSYGFYDAEAK